VSVIREKGKHGRESPKQSSRFSTSCQNPRLDWKAVGGLHVALHIFKYLLVAQTSVPKDFLSAGPIDSPVHPVLSAATHEYVGLLDTSSQCSSSILARYFIVYLQETMTIDVVLVRLQLPLAPDLTLEYLNHHGPSRLLRRLMHGQRDEAWIKRSFQPQQPTMKSSTFFVTLFRHCISLRRWRCE